MAFKHGKDTFVSVAANDLSAFTNTSQLTESADSHDVTAYGQQAHRKQGGLDDGTFTMGGTYDSGATGPRAILKPLKGTVVAVIRRPEGIGAGLPQDSFSALLTQYVETNPVADMIAWSAEFEIDGPVDSTAQV